MQPPMRDTEDQAVDLGGTGRAPVGGAGDAAAPEQTETSGPAVAAEAAPVSADPAAPELTTASGQAMAPGQAAGPGPAATPSIRASDRERDAATQQLQAAFAEGRIDDAEFDERMRTALTARTRGDLDTLLSDLPDSLPGLPARSPTTVVGRPPGRFAITFKSSIRRAGRWRVPDRYTAVIYKGTGWLDLRAAELTAPVTTIMVVAYKSRVDILVPPGVRVEVGGFGATTGEEDDAVLPPDAPVVHVRGYAYKGIIEARSRPPEH